MAMTFLAGVFWKVELTSSQVSRSPCFVVHVRASRNSLALATGVQADAEMAVLVTTGRGEEGPWCDTTGVDHEVVHMSC